MALIDTDKNGLGAGSHRQPGSAEVLLGSSLLEQHPTALIETPLQDPRGSAHTKPKKMILLSMILPILPNPPCSPRLCENP
jgi:hypothetical protein